MRRGRRHRAWCRAVRDRDETETADTGTATSPRLLLRRLVPVRPRSPGPEAASTTTDTAGPATAEPATAEPGTNGHDHATHEHDIHETGRGHLRRLHPRGRSRPLGPQRLGARRPARRARGRGGVRARRGGVRSAAAVRAGRPEHPGNPVAGRRDPARADDAHADRLRAESFSARFSCRAARAAGATPDGYLLTTMSPNSADFDDTALSVRVRSDVVTVRSGGQDIVAERLPAGDCSYEVAGNAAAVTVTRDGRPLGVLRPRLGEADPDGSRTSPRTRAGREADQPAPRHRRPVHLAARPAGRHPGRPGRERAPGRPLRQLAERVQVGPDHRDRAGRRDRRARDDAASGSAAPDPVAGGRRGRDGRGPGRRHDRGRPGVALGAPTVGPGVVGPGRREDSRRTGALPPPARRPGRRRGPAVLALPRPDDRRRRLLRGDGGRRPARGLRPELLPALQPGLHAVLLALLPALVVGAAGRGLAGRAAGAVGGAGHPHLVRDPGLRGALPRGDPPVARAPVVGVRQPGRARGGVPRVVAALRRRHPPRALHRRVRGRRPRRRRRGHRARTDGPAGPRRRARRDRADDRADRFHLPRAAARGQPDGVAGDPGAVVALVGDPAALARGDRARGARRHRGLRRRDLRGLRPLTADLRADPAGRHLVPGVQPVREPARRDLAVRGLRQAHRRADLPAGPWCGSSSPR